MSLIHSTPHEGAGKTYLLKDGSTEYQLEDWWDRVAGRSWMYSDGNPAAFHYAMRSATAWLPLDNEVVYGKVGGFGVLVHVSELSAPTAQGGGEQP